MDRRTFAALPMLLLVACSGSSTQRAAGDGTTTTSPHATTFSLRPVVSTSAPPCHRPLVAGTAKCYRLAAPIIGRADVQSALAIYDRNQQQWIISLTVTNAAQPRFEHAMQHNVGHDVAIVIDGKVVVAPRVFAGITGRSLEISGNFDQRTAEGIAAGLTKLRPPDPRQRASVCTSADLRGMSTPFRVLPYRRLATAGTYWFGRVRLTPPSKDAHPAVSQAQAWGSGLVSTYPAGIYEVVLANWTSDAGLVMDSHGKAVPHDHVLAWVIIGKHVPVAASDVSASVTVPGVPCYFGTSIAAVDATTGRGIADASDYSG